MSTINGKKPLSSKPKAQAQLREDDLFGNPLSIDNDTKKALEAKGLAYRFINAAQVKEMGGYHQFGWRPIKAKDVYANMTTDIQFGMDPDGYIRRGDLVLAVRSKDINDKHVRHLKEKADAVSHKQLQKNHARELREFARKNELDTIVDEGYGEED